MGRPPEHDEETARRLLDAAEGLVRTGGPDAVAVRAAAREADVSTQAVYSLFGGKDGLLQALAVRGYGLLTDLVRGTPTTDDPAADLVTIGIEGFRTFALSHPGLFRLAFERVPATVVADSRAARAALASYDSLIARVERAQAADVLEDRPVDEIGFAFHSCCVGLATSELSREPPPVGSGFWRPVRGIDGSQLWRVALSALIEGFATAS